jgi:glycosyltransferase involved in cell wall biosynthesis
MRVVHAIHDFLPRHRAGSEIYAFELVRELSSDTTCFILAAEYDPAAAHGTLRWRWHEGLTVVELVNNWQFDRFDETYSSERINAQLRHVLDATSPDVLHVHNLLNLSFDLPRIARERGIPVVATLHDYTLVCPSGGQRVHVSESHVCETIDADRCARCFGQSAFSRQMRAASVTRGRSGRIVLGAGRMLHRFAPRLALSAVQSIGAPEVTPSDIRRRLAYARHVFEAVDLFVAPSASLAREFAELGMPRERIDVSDYGFRPPVNDSPAGPRQDGPLRVGFVGTLVWHKGAHVLLEAARGLCGEFEVVIHGDTNVFPEYVATLRTSAIGVPVTFAGGFDRERIEDVYRTFDVLVVSSLWPENSPLVIHEAFMRGVPVVGARVGGIPELVQDGINGLLYEPFSAESLRSSLQRLIDDRPLLTSLSRQMPGVKSIHDDALEWRERYRAVCGRATSRPVQVCR